MAIDKKSIQLIKKIVGKYNLEFKLDFNTRGFDQELFKTIIFTLFDNSDMNMMLKLIESVLYKAYSHKAFESLLYDSNSKLLDSFIYFIKNGNTSQKAIIARLFYLVSPDLKRFLEMIIKHITI